MEVVFVCIGCVVVFLMLVGTIADMIRKGEM